MTMMCSRVLRSGLAFSSSSRSGAATTTALTSALLKTWAISALENKPDVGRKMPPIFSTAKLTTRAGGILGARRATRSPSSMPKAFRLLPTLFTMPRSAL